ncbi:M15 family metallopeptidase [Ornithinibacillus gellani]|uniref:M15 family metallopeptidase n=1 Tax=Ornithinibacillus gellani TaxID=2293253 RepID=UPI001CC1F266|nr:D-alanyl-D-alanine carboxypeptidase family protein [Ornithinibacillus gellani]
MTLYKNIRHWIIFFSILFLLAGCAQAKQNKEDEEALRQIKADMTKIYNEDFDDLHASIEEETLNDVGKRLEELNNKENVSDDNQTLLNELTTQYDMASQMYHLEQEINHLMEQDGQLKTDLLAKYEKSIDPFESYTTYYNRQTENLQTIHDAVEKRIAQEKHIEKTEKFIASLYENDQLIDSLTKKDYEKLEKLIKKMEDEEMVKTFQAELNKVDKKLTAIAKEKAEEEKRIAVEEERKEKERKEKERLAAKEKEKTDTKQNESENETKKEHNKKEKAPAKDKEQPTSGDGLPSKPTYVDGVVIASKKYPLPANYAPGESGEARSAFNAMAKAAKTDGIELTAFSTYRSFDYQKNLYNDYVARDGQEAADRYSARPGYSEHQTGLAFDIGDRNNQGAFFQENRATNWLAKEAYKYGFILRYPNGKEGITGYMYEPWHYRYVGKNLAEKIYHQQSTLEEYFGL